MIYTSFLKLFNIIIKLNTNNNTNFVDVYTNLNHNNMNSKFIKNINVAFVDIPAYATRDSKETNGFKFDNAFVQAINACGAKYIKLISSSKYSEDEYNTLLSAAKFDFDVEDVDIETFTDKQTQNYARPENIKKMINRYKDKLKIGNKGCIVVSNASLCYRAGFMAHCFTYKKDDFINHYLHLNC